MGSLSRLNGFVTMSIQNLLVMLLIYIAALTSDSETNSQFSENDGIRKTMRRVRDKNKEALENTDSEYK